MAQKGGVIRVNRAPVLTLWAAIVAERMGHDANAAITLGRAVAGSRHARSGWRRSARTAACGTQQTVHLLGRDLPVAERNGSPYALDHDKPASPRPAHAYVETAFGEHLPAVRKAMEAEAAAMQARLERAEEREARIAPAAPG